MMNSYGFSRFIGGLLLVSAVLALPTRAQVAPTVVISEINWGGSEASIADEWLELVNLGAATLDVSGWVLTGTATSGGAIALEEGTVIEPGTTLLISNYPMGDEKTTLNVAPDLVTTAMSLPNSNLEILLTTPDGLVIDSYVDAGTPDFGSSSPAVSIARDLTTLAWQSSVSSLNLTNSDGTVGAQLGTPAAVNLPVNETLPAPEEPPVIEPTPEPAQEPVPEPADDSVTAPAETEPAPGCGDPDLTSDTESTEPVEEAPVPDDSEPPQPQSPDEVNPNPDGNVGANPILPGQLLINELVSDPLDDIEWVEILNASDLTLDLSGATLLDASLHVTELPTQNLNAGAFLVIENPNGHLNNTGDSLQVFDAYGSLIDSLTYGTDAVPAPEDGESIARTPNGDWLITTATQGTANVFPEDSDSVETTESTNTNQPTTDYETPTDDSDAPSNDPGTTPGPMAETDEPEPAPTQSLHRIVAIAKSLTVQHETKTSTQGKVLMTISGPVVALPNTFGKQSLFIDGHEIYFHAALWPELALGDVITVTGTPSTHDGNPRLKISSAEDIVITGHVDLTPLPLDGSEFQSAVHGQLVSIAGQVVGKDGYELFVLTEDGVTITVLGNKKTGVSWSSIQTGAIIVSGLVRDGSQGLRLAVRSQGDVHYTPDIASASTLNNGENKSATPWVGGGLLTGSLGALGTWYLRSKKGIHLPF